MTQHGPVEIVDQRLRHVVAGKPGKMHLGELELDFVELGIAIDHVVRAAAEVLFDGDDLADWPSWIRWTASR